MSSINNARFRSTIFGVVATLPLWVVCAQASEGDTPTGEIESAITMQPVEPFGPTAKAGGTTFLGETDRHYIPVPDKDGGCNSDAWYQIPGHPDFFAGRYIESKTCTPDGSVPDGLMDLGLAQMSRGKDGFPDGFVWVNRALLPYTQSASVLSGDGKYYTVHAQTIQDGYVIYTAYDPSVISYEGELWVAFECAYVGAHAADSCMGPLITNHDETGTHWYVDPARTTVVVSDGSANPYDVYTHAASVPKLVVFQGSVYLYYSSGRYGHEGVDINVRGVKLWQDAGSTGKVFRVHGLHQPAFAYDNATSIEVMGVERGERFSNRVADAFGAYTDGTYIYLTGAVGGGTSCAGLGGTGRGCYRLSIARTTSPLAYHAFNSVRVPDGSLPVNPQEYTRQLIDQGSSYFLGNYFANVSGYDPPNAIPPSTREVGNDVVHGMWLYPANFATLDFKQTTMGDKPDQSWFGNYFDPFKLVAGQSFTVGHLKLSMQSDGNLVIYHDGVKGDDKARWATGTDKWPSTCTTCYASFQSDGNLVLYSPDGNGEYTPYWSTGTNGHPGAQLLLSDAFPYLSIVQGVEIYPLNNPGPSYFAPFNLLAGQRFITGDLTLSMQADGNLAVYRGGLSLWATGTNNWPSTCTTCYASMQADGNLVLYSPDGNGEYTPYWSTGTNGHPGAQLLLSDNVPHLSIVQGLEIYPVDHLGPSHFGPFNLLAGQSFLLGDLTLSMQADGNLVLYRGGSAIWATGTNNRPSTCTACDASFQSDGNLVLYSPDRNGEYTSYWSTGIKRHTGAQLVLSDAVPYLSIVVNSTQVWP
jgi:hypothetical protein